MQNKYKKIKSIVKTVFTLLGAVIAFLATIVGANPELFGKAIEYLSDRSEHQKEKRLKKVMLTIGDDFAKFDAENKTASMIVRRSFSHQYEIIWLNPTEAKLWNDWGFKVGHFLPLEKDEVRQDFNVTLHGCASEVIRDNKVCTICKITTNRYLWVLIGEESMAIEMERSLDGIRERVYKRN